MAWLSLPPEWDSATSAPRSISSRHSDGMGRSYRRRGVGMPLMLPAGRRCSSAMLVVMTTIPVWPSARRVEARPLPRSGKRASTVRHGPRPPDGAQQAGGEIARAAVRPGSAVGSETGC